MTLILGALIFWISAWILNARLADSALAETRFVKLLVPLIFGFTIVGVWELLVRGLSVPLVILPPPSLVSASALSASLAFKIHAEIQKIKAPRISVMSYPSYLV